MKLSELAKAIGAQLRAAQSGDEDRVVESCGTLEDATDRQVSFLANPRYQQQLKETRAAAVIVSPKVDAAGRTVLIADDPYFTFRNAVIALHGYRVHPHPADGTISERAVIDPTAEIGEGTVVHPFAVICAGAKIGRNCILYPNVFIGPYATIGEDCQLYPGVTVYDHCVLGNRVTLHAGTVIGQDGFGYATHKGAHHKIPQAGIAIVEDDVEMGANCSIDRATIGATVIGKGTKFSDSVVIGHGTTVGRHNLFVALVGIAGSVEFGDYVVLGGQVGIAGHLKIGHQVQIAATSGVMSNIPDKEIWGGTPATPMADQKRALLHTAKLPDLAKRVKQLEKEIESLRQQLEDQKPF